MGALLSIMVVPNALKLEAAAFENCLPSPLIRRVRPHFSGPNRRHIIPCYKEKSKEKAEASPEKCLSKLGLAK